MVQVAKSPEDKSVPRGVSLPQKVWDEIEREAEETGMNKSSLIQQAWRLRKQKQEFEKLAASL